MNDGPRGLGALPVADGQVLAPLLPPSSPGPPLPPHAAPPPPSTSSPPPPPPPPPPPRSRVGAASAGTLPPPPPSSVPLPWIPTAPPGALSHRITPNHARLTVPRMTPSRHWRRRHRRRSRVPVVVVAVALVAGSVFALKSCGDNPFAAQQRAQAGMENAVPATVG